MVGRLFWQQPKARRPGQRGAHLLGDPVLGTPLRSRHLLPTLLLLGEEKGWRANQEEEEEERDSATPPEEKPP